MSFEIILPGAWELTKDEDEPRQLFALYVPTPWQQVAKSLAVRRARLQGKGYQSPPVYSLDPLVVASFPRIIQTVRKGWQKPNLPWLLAKERISDLSLLALLIKDWLREEFSQNLGESEVELSLERLNEGDWQWEREPRTYSLLHPKNDDEKNVLYGAIPNFLAQEFLKNPSVSFCGRGLTFYRVVRLKEGELMSWPPYPISLTNFKGEERTERAFVSFVIRFVVQTVPWRKSPLVYHQVSLRRWIVKPLERLPYRGLTAYVGNELRLLDGVRQPLCFMPLSMRRRGQEPGWSKAIRQLLADDTRLPAANTLLGNPTYNWAEFGMSHRPTQAAIAFDARQSQWSSGPLSLPGVSSLDLAYIDQAIQERLPVKRVGEAVKVGSSIRFHDLSTRPKNKKDDDRTDSNNGQPVKHKKVKKTDPNQLSTPMLRPTIAAPAVFRSTKESIGTILILWETPQCRDALITEIRQLLCLSPTGEMINYTTPSGAVGQAQLYQGSFGSLCIKTQHVEDLTHNLDIDRPSVPGSNRQQRRIHLLEERISQIVLSLTPTDVLSGALIEIRPKAFPPEADPKLAWRIAPMQVGYLNQHIHALTYNYKGEEKTRRDASERVKRAVSDLLRQCGVLPGAPLIQPKDGIRPHVWLTCFYVLRRTRRTTASNLPNTVVMMVRVNPIEANVEVTTPSLFEKNRENPWVPYPIALKYLLSETWDPNSDFDETSEEVSDERRPSEKEEALLNKFVSECLLDCLHTEIANTKHPYVLFMAEAQNARRKGLLSWLRNPDLDLPFGELPKALDIQDPEEKERLWIVRLRLKGNTNEVPVAIVKNSLGNRATLGSRARGAIYQWQGVCEDKRQSLYLSMRRALNTEQYSLKTSHSRLDSGSRPAANARLLEIAVVHSPGIKPAKLAHFVHLLRGRWPYSADDVSLPLPFPFAVKAKEYAVSARDSVEVVEFNDSNQDTINRNEQ